MSDTTETVRQIQTSDGLYDIEAPRLVEDNEYTVNGMHVKTSTGSAIIKFNETTEGTGGRIEFNSEGNIAIESLDKHVNIEAKKGIQMKPTTNIIFDSGRRILNNEGNEVHLQFVFDDYDSDNTGNYAGDDEEYAELKIEARNIDLRCFDHGGIALQPCGTDGDDFENKIKFESSRISPLGTIGTISYADEGGKGLEFGTFNNEHTSLFTGDYRFNKDGMVYAVTRGTPETSDGKTDYPTQEDDFKDIVDSTLGVTWEDIVISGKQVTNVISKSGNMKSYKGLIQNTMHIPVHLDANKVVYLSTANLDTVYDGEGNVFTFGPSVISSTAVYTDAAHTTPVAASSKLFLQASDDTYWIADINSSSQINEWGSSDHEQIPDARVKTAPELSGMTVTTIAAGGFANFDENPVLKALHTIITDAEIDTYAEFVAAVKSAFGWT